MRIFAQVVDQGSFTRAAASLGLSKATISKQVARLEERLGARLLNRTTRRLHLTDAGQAYYQACSRILHEIEAAEGAVAQLQSKPRGRLRVSGPVSFGQRFLGAAIAELMTTYPELEVELVLSDRFVDIVEEGFDVAVRIASLTDSSLIARRLGPMRGYVCASPDYLRAHGHPQRPADLAGHNCLLYSHESTGPRWSFKGESGQTTVQVEGTLRVNNGDVLRQAALHGVGLAFLPGFIVEEDIRRGRLVSVLEEWTEWDAGIYAVYPHRRHLAAKVRVFVDFMVGRFDALELEH